MSTLTFRDIEGLGFLRRFQEDIYQVAGIPFVLADAAGADSRRLAASDKWNPMCNLVRSSAAGNMACETCDKAAYARGLQSRKPVMYSCHLGLQDIAVPLFVRGNFIAMMCSGQFLLAPPTEKGFQQMKPKLAALDVDMRKARRFYFATPVVPRKKAQAIIHLISLVSEYVAEAEQTIMEIRSISQRDQVRRAQELIEARYAERMSLKDVANAVGLSASRLAHLLKERLNTTFTEYRNQVRVERAKFLLANSNLKTIDIGYEVGFGSPSNFHSVFHCIAACSPLKYRRRQSGS